MFFKIIYFLLLYLLLSALIKRVVRAYRKRKIRLNRYNSPNDKKRYRPGEIEDAEFEELDDSNDNRE